MIVLQFYTEGDGDEDGHKKDCILLYHDGAIPTSLLSMTDTNDDEEKCVDGLGVIGRAKAGLRDPLRLLYRHPLRHRRHHHNYHCHRRHCFYRQHP